MARALDHSLFELRKGGVVNNPPLPREGYLRLKRFLDISFALSILVFLGPLMSLIAFGIKLYSPGPVLFRQPRVGKDGKIFTCYKFRSMRNGVDPARHREHVARQILENGTPAPLAGASLKLRNDPRITGLGQILRRSSLDELPQIWNVLRGEMSFVGPRPPIPYEVDLYQDWHKGRFAALPGITGFWQVEGRNRMSFDEMVRMDIYYIREMSLWFDLLIILKTPMAMLIGKGAG